MGIQHNHEENEKARKTIMMQAIMIANFVVNIVKDRVMAVVK